MIDRLVFGAVGDGGEGGLTLRKCLLLSSRVIIIVDA